MERPGRLGLPRASSERAQRHSAAPPQPRHRHHHHQPHQQPHQPPYQQYQQLELAPTPGLALAPSSAPSSASGSASGSAPGLALALAPASGSSGGGRAAPLLEGPLPAEVREIIYAACAGEAAETAEKHARRLLSMSRRVRVYREELQSAAEEAGDVARLVQRHQTVQEALRSEMSELDVKIDQLMRERRLCEQQLKEEDDALRRRYEKLEEANERVHLLRSTIDAITQESLKGHVMLRQLVPNLHVDNYLS